MQQDSDFQNEEKFRIVLCGASKYEQKYYFNHKFDKLPENVKEELRVICVLFAQEVGGIFLIGFTPVGEVMMDSRADEGDLLYDDIGSGLMMKEIRRKKQDLFESLEAYFKIQFLHMRPADVLQEDDDSTAEGNADDVPLPEGTTFHSESVPGDED